MAQGCTSVNGSVFRIAVALRPVPPTLKDDDDDNNEDDDDDDDGEDEDKDEDDVDEYGQGSRSYKERLQRASGKGLAN